MTDKNELHEARRRSVDKRREKAAEEMRQIVLDAEHWNRTHPDEEPIIIEPDLTKEVEALKAQRSGCNCGIEKCEGHVACVHPPGSRTCEVCTLPDGDETSSAAVAARALKTRRYSAPLQMFVARCDDIYEAHWVVAESEEAAQALLDQWRLGAGWFASGEDGEEPEWSWTTLGADEILTEQGGAENGGDLSMPVRQWIEQRGRCHVSWSEVG